MLHTPRATRGMVVAPHHLAAQAGLRVLREGGNAIEAMVAAGATIAVVYPHMNSLGGDNFWLLTGDDGAPTAIDACGAAANAVSIDLYRNLGYGNIPARGPLAAITVAGAVSGWAAALDIAARWGGRLPLARLLEDATYYANAGVPTTRSQHQNTADHLDELLPCPGFAEVFLNGDQAPTVGTPLRQPRLAATLERLALKGLDDFYRGEIAASIAADLAHVDSPLRAADLNDHRALTVTPLSVALDCARVYQLPPPTQGLASLIILALFDRMRPPEADGFDHVHRLIEATKGAFRVRDAHIADPATMRVDPREYLDAARLDALAGEIDLAQAAPWATGEARGDTVWLGAIDDAGRAVSFIQSIYWEFGSGLVLPQTGITWQNRGASFRLDAEAPNALAPGRRPFHTIHPALARLRDGRLMVYGCMGGDGQPQTQAAVFSRYAMYDQPLQQAVTAPRWLLGRTWGTPRLNLTIERRFPAEVREALARAGHDVEVVAGFDERMGHAGAIVRRPDGVIEGAADPRGDGAAAAY